MEVSSSNSDKEMEMIDEVFDKFKLAYNNVFQKDKDLMSDSSEESPNDCFNKQKSYKEDLIDKKERSKVFNISVKNKESNDNIIGIFEKESVEIKNIPEVLKIYKDEDYILFCPGKNMEYYQKYTSQFIFDVWKNKILRKDKIDDIMKKIKARFFKALKICINETFKGKGIEKKLEYLPQQFLTNINKNENKLMLEKNLEEIILELKEYNSETKKGQEKIKNNIALIEYLKQENNSNNQNLKKIYNIFKTKIKVLFNEYLKSKKFEESIIKLKEEGNYSEYIKEYIKKAENFINYFSN